MPRTRTLMVSMAVVMAAGACVRYAPLAPIGLAGRGHARTFLVERQGYWCETITDHACPVHLSAVHPQYAAWVDWGARPPAIFWNERVLTDRRSWISDSRMAHEACHLKHGPQPGWSVQQKELFANLCAIEHTGAVP